MKALLATLIVSGALSAIAVPPISAADHWVRLTPPIAATAGLAYDPADNRLFDVPSDGNSPGGEVWTHKLAAGEAWRKLESPTQPGLQGQLRASFIDPASHRLIALVGFTGLGGIGLIGHQNGLEVYARGTGDADSWSQLTTVEALPLDRTRFAFVHDTRHDRYILFGGNLFDNELAPDTWVLTLDGASAHWRQVAIDPPPDPRADAAAVYDPIHDQVILFGGMRGLGGGVVEGPTGDLLSLSLGDPPAIDSISATGPAPPVAFHNAGFWDSARSRVILDTERPADGANDMWALDLASAPRWEHLGTTTVPPVFQVGAMFPAGAGGSAVAVAAPLGTYVIDPADPVRWSLLDDPFDNGPGRMPRLVLTDPTSGTYLTTANWAFNGADMDLWRMSLTTPPRWQKISGASAPPTAASYTTAFAYDTRRARWILIVGSQVWALSVAPDPRWSRIEVAGIPPTRSDGAAAAYDPLRDRIVMFGGGSYAGTDSVFVLSLSGSPRWDRPVVSATRPRTRSGAAMLWDTARDRAIVFGGQFQRPPGLTEPPPPHYMNDTWALAGTDTVEWDSVRISSILPISQSNPLVYYDASTDGMEVVGGMHGFATPNFRLSILEELALSKPEAWALPGPFAFGTPPQASPAVLGTLASPTACDQARDRVVSVRTREGVWTLDRGQPTHIALLDLSPGDATNTLRPDAHGLVTCAILSDPTFDARTVDPASVTLAGAPASAAAAADRATMRDVNGDGRLDRVLKFARADMTLDPSVDVVALAGRTQSGEAVVGWDLYRLDPSAGAGAGGRIAGANGVSPAGDPDAPNTGVIPAHLGISFVGAGALRGAATVRLALPHAASDGMIEIFAVDGRRVARRELGALSAGTRTIALGETATLASGVYFARVRVGGESASTRFVALR